jgi:hypothetical protein
MCHICNHRQLGRHMLTPCLTHSRVDWGVSFTPSFCACVGWQSWIQGRRVQIYQQRLVHACWLLVQLWFIKPMM